MITLLLSISLEFFWTLINSQINFIYMPLLTVNAPGVVSFYLDVLIYVCTFDPIPMDIIYEVVPFWHFDRVGMETDRNSFPRIGIEDRNMVGILGSMMLFLAMFFATQVIYGILKPFEPHSRHVRKVIRFVSPEAAYRTIFVIFFLEAYLDLALGGLVNTENDYLLDDPALWGPRGMLTKSDQFAIILGNIFYIITSLFPWIVMFLMERKY